MVLPIKRTVVARRMCGVDNILVVRVHACASDKVHMTVAVRPCQGYVQCNTSERHLDSYSPFEFAMHLSQAALMLQNIREHASAMTNVQRASLAKLALRLMQVLWRL